MKLSEQSARLLRNLSLTHRARLIPEMACSTRTRTRDRARLCRFSAGLSSVPFGFFHLMRLLNLRLITLKPRVFVQHGPARVSNLLLVSNFLAMRFARIGRAEIADPSALCLNNN